VARKGRQALGGQRGPAGAVGRRVNVPLCARVSSTDPPPEKVERANHDREHVVEVVRDAAGKLPHRLHLLTLA